MSLRSDRFNRSMRHTELMFRVSDEGLGLERLVEAVDYDEAMSAAEWHEALGQENASAVGAVLRLVWAEKHHLAKVLNLIFENVNERRLSIAKVKKRSYFRARNALLEFFVAL